ncbi:hypothetical protein [Pseudomonas protegens]|uniref:hypothetical protein n=1 Tax=Pseudomonas protegens TaxID=380021 RepID=UPI001B313255|nr:hypothetical protein [Pseudomonas protegens]MBP5097200.1 hypothetical protein [Pseudomonas protegens]QTU04238.1 hypothetical protein HUT25_00260 [Pseudomonas protegens]QTU10548.1 hypothetical protein HUT23_00950 [Pseudomonas protegens]QTU42074.1 hypothetical protein HUT24_31350 [Pseudomonas protegens]
MTDARQTPTPEEQMLAHIRQHSAQEPPAHLDALILATARREAPAPKPGLWQRWMRACQRPRYQLAFASLFGVALVIGLLRPSPEHYPQEQAFVPAPAPAPAAPMARQAAPRSAELAGALSVPEPAAPSPIAPAAPVGSFAAAPEMEASADAAPPAMAKPRAESSKLAKRMSAPAAPRAIKRLNEQLQTVLRLWDEGQNRAAAELLLQLQETYPQEDLDARLQALRRQ